MGVRPQKYGPPEKNADAVTGLDFEKRERKRMKTIGIVRKIDDLGRVVIPREIRRNLGIREGDPFEIFMDEDEIILRKYNASIGLEQHVRRLEDAFSEVKNEMDADTANQICEHIEALKNIFTNMDKR